MTIQRPIVETPKLRGVVTPVPRTLRLHKPSHKAQPDNKYGANATPSHKAQPDNKQDINAIPSESARGTDPEILQYALEAINAAKALELLHSFPNQVPRLEAQPKKASDDTKPNSYDISNIYEGTLSPAVEQTIQELYENLPNLLNPEHSAVQKPKLKIQSKAGSNETDIKGDATSELGLRAVFGAVAGILFTIIRQNVFGQVPTFDQLYSAGLTCATKATTMGIANQFVRKQIKKLPELSKSQKDILQAASLSILEAITGLKQESSIATQHSTAAVFTLSAARSFPSNLLETSMKEDFKTHLQQYGISENLVDAVLISSATIANLIPATLLNNQPITPENLVKTFVLRFISMGLWQKAMEKAKDTAQKWAENDANQGT
jgi:hypothetical protein